MNESKTPKTDSELERMRDGGCPDVVTGDFCRRIELELFELKKVVGHWRDLAFSSEAYRKEAEQKLNIEIELSRQKLSEVRNHFIEQRDQLARALRYCMKIIGSPNDPDDTQWWTDDQLNKAWNDGHAALSSITKENE